jgi:hypothetical protein
MKRTLIFLIACFFMTPLLAAPLSVKEPPQEKEDNRFPLGCRAMGYQHDLMVLKLQPEVSGVERQTMYFLFNDSTKPLNLFQVRNSETVYDVFMNHSINPKQWAVLSLSEPQVKFICTINDPKTKYGKIVDCAQTLKVCEFNRVVFGLNNRGNFWIVKNNTRNGALRDVVRYGIIPAV